MQVGDRLTERFVEFCESLGQAERIDALSLTDEQQRAKKADFFFLGRRIVCEIKTLESDTNDKIVRVLYDAGIRLADGHYAIQDVLADREDADVLYRKCFNAMSTAVADAVDDANRQIRETKKAFGIMEADGLLILLHGRVAVLNPDVILKRVAQRLNKRTPAGTPTHEHLTQVVLFSEVHKLKTNDGRLLAAVMPYRNTAVPERFGASVFAHVLAEGWSQWNGRTFSVLPRLALSPDYSRTQRTKAKRALASACILRVSSQTEYSARRCPRRDRV